MTEWDRIELIQAGRCPRLTLPTRFGPLWVMRHDAACQRETGVAAGWTVTCHRLGVRGVPLDGVADSDEAGACAAGVAHVAGLLRAGAAELESV